MARLRLEHVEILLDQRPHRRVEARLRGRVGVARESAGLNQEIIAAPLGRGGDEVDDIAGNAFRPVAREAARADERDARIDQHRRWEDEAADLPAVDATRLAEHLRPRSEEHTSELQSLMRISYAVFCLKAKNITTNNTNKP